MANGAFPHSTIDAVYLGEQVIDGKKYEARMLYDNDDYVIKIQMQRALAALNKISVEDCNGSFLGAVYRDENNFVVGDYKFKKEIKDNNIIQTLYYKDSPVLQSTESETLSSELTGNDRHGLPKSEIGENCSLNGFGEYNRSLLINDCYKDLVSIKNKAEDRYKENLVEEARKAVVSGDEKKLDDLVSKGLDVNESLGMMYSPLLKYAIVNNQPKMIEKLIELGESLDSRDCIGDHLMHIAAQNGNTDLINRMVDQGIDVNIRNSCGDTPLIQSVQKGQVESVKTLLANDAHTHVLNLYNNSAISLTLEQSDPRKPTSFAQDNPEIFELLKPYNHGNILNNAQGVIETISESATDGVKKLTDKFRSASNVSDNKLKP